MNDDEKRAKRLARIHGMRVSDVYPLYRAKVERKGRDASDVDEIIYWLTGYDAASLGAIMERGTTFEEFFRACPRFNGNAAKITGKICGCDIASIEDETERRVRYLDKMVDELARGVPMERILRT